jgi:uncharacterized protein YecE (DUF72 family)
MLKIGCCGFPTGKEKYYKKFDVVEVQQTFYKPMQVDTAKQWRVQAPRKFEFTVKAWQLITHPASSPTYRKAKLDLRGKNLNHFGSFQPTREVYDAWDTIREICDALQAKCVLFQCPSSFRPLDENLKNMREFFSTIADSKKYTFIWEPRGKLWGDALVRELCEELNLVHCVDPFVRKTVHGKIVYFRLHGIGGYNYKYTKSDLSTLLDVCKSYKKKTIYCMFNNTTMAEDARRFMTLVNAN